MKKTLFALALVGCLALPRGAEAALIVYGATLGPEVAGSSGSGEVTVTWDSTAQTLLIEATFAGLTGTTTVAHIHCCTATPFTGTVAVAVTPGTLPGFPAGVTAGSYTSPLLDLTDSATFTSGFVTNFAGGQVAAAEAALIAGINDGRAYFNVHTTFASGGEIRGFLTPVPEPSTLLLLGMAGALAAVRSRRR
jgi:hypothetical protein